MFVAFRAARAISAGEELTVALRVDPHTHLRHADPSFSQWCF